MKKRNMGKVIAALLAAALMLPIFPVGEVSADDATNVQGQSGLTEGETYWFDLSDEGIPGTVNTDLPSGSLSWVPFTYVGEVDAYVLNSSSNGVAESSEKAASATSSSSSDDKTYGYAYSHSLFISDYNVTYNVSWSDLNNAGLIFGETYSSGGIEYILRAPSMGSSTGVDYDYSKGVPGNNELDVILGKTENAVKNYRGIYSWGQDTNSSDNSYRSLWGLIPNEYITSALHFSADLTAKDITGGFRPVLELPADSLSGLTTVTIDLNGGSLNGSTDTVELVVKSGDNYTAPSVNGLTAPEGKGFGYWQTENETNYRVGDTVLGSVTSLTAQWIDLPVVKEQLQSATYYVGDTATPLTVEASVTDGGRLEYHWYSATKDDYTDIAEIAGASSNTYTPSTTEVGTTYYFCSVISVNGIGLSAIMLEPAKVIVKAKDTTPPVISGIENGKTYCSSVTFTVEDDNLASVTASVATAEGTKTETLTPDSDGKYTLAAVNETYTVTATDTAGSKTEYKVTVNDGHTFEWKIDKEAAVGVTGSKHEECTVCGYAKAAVEIPALLEPESPIEDENNDGTDDGNNGGNGDEYGDVNGGASGDVKGNVADRKQDGGDEGVSDDNSAQDGGVRAVQTGDDGSVVLPLMSLLMSSFGITGSIAYGQKKRKMRK